MKTKDRFTERQREAIRRAKEYREKYGDPIDNLVNILQELASNTEEWQAIIDEPYG